MLSSFASVRKVRHLAEESCAAIVMFPPPGFTGPACRSMNSADAKSNPCCSSGKKLLGQGVEWGTGGFHCRKWADSAGPMGKPPWVAFKHRCTIAHSWNTRVQEVTSSCELTLGKKFTRH